MKCWVGCRCFLTRNASLGYSQLSVWHGSATPSLPSACDTMNLLLQWSLNNTKHSWALYQRAVVTLLLSGLFLPAVMGSPEWFELLRKSFCVQPFVVDASQSLKPKSNPLRWWTCKQRGAKVLENCKIALSLPFTIQVSELHHGGKQFHLNEKKLINAKSCLDKGAGVNMWSSLHGCADDSG